MWTLFRSLRIRLVVTFVAVVGMINALLGLGGVALREWQLRSRFDQQLLEIAGREAVRIGRQLNGADRAQLEMLLNERSSAYGNDLYLQLAQPEGTIVARTSSLNNVPLPAARSDASDAAFSTDELASIRTIPGPSPPRLLRVTAVRLAGPQGEHLILQVGRSFDEVREGLAFLQLLFWIVIPLSMLAAAIAGWIVTGRPLDRLNQVSRLARTVTPEHLDQRITVATDGSGSGDEISQLADEVNHMLARLESSFRAQERFITNASHELQTPIAVLLSEAQLLKDAQPDPTTEEYRGFIRSVEQEMRQLTRIISSLLSLIRMESGELQRAETILSLNEVLVTAGEECRAAAQRRGVSLRLTLPDPDAAEPGDGPPPEPLVVGDPGLLQIMVENLLRNAIRNSPSDGRVTLNLDLDIDQAIITVYDQGPTLSRKSLNTAFERTGRSAPTVGNGDTEAGNTASERDGRQGSGLELTIAKAIADLHSGAIGVRNVTGNQSGVAFFVWLPLVSAEESGSR